ncbi:MAG: hypothetical protein HYW24_03360 [Candidatus Aenigmarchaeota archaeon]|nr:hypothetical protein [Candidatus Aenigmarchaeota archaeon]
MRIYDYLNPRNIFRGLATLALYTMLVACSGDTDSKKPPSYTATPSSRSYATRTIATPTPVLFPAYRSDARPEADHVVVTDSGSVIVTVNFLGYPVDAKDRANHTLNPPAITPVPLKEVPPVTREVIDLYGHSRELNILSLLRQLQDVTGDGVRDFIIEYDEPKKGPVLEIIDGDNYRTLFRGSDSDDRDVHYSFNSFDIENGAIGIGNKDGTVIRTVPMVLRENEKNKCRYPYPYTDSVRTVYKYQNGSYVPVGEEWMFCVGNEPLSVEEISNLYPNVGSVPIRVKMQYKPEWAKNISENCTVKFAYDPTSDRSFPAGSKFQLENDTCWK